MGSGAVLLRTASAATEPVIQDAYTDLRDRWREIITGASRIDLSKPELVAAVDRMDNAVDTWVSRVDRSSSRTKVFTDLELKQSSDSSMLAGTYGRLERMAVAWSTPGSRHHQSPSLLADVLAGLDTANRLVYYAGRAEFDNWYHWEIAASRALANSLVLLDGQIPAAARDRYVAAIRHFVPDPWYQYIDSRRKLSTAANRVDLCQAAIVEGIASRSSSRIERGASGLPVVCQNVDSKNGFYADGSFIYHDTVAYTGTYGTVLLGGMAKLLALLTGSAWEITDPAIANLLTMVEQGFAPLMHDGRMMSMVRGRAISRSSDSEQANGHRLVAAILQLAPAASPAMADGWRALCRGSLERNTGRPPYTSLDVPTTALFSTLLHDQTVTPAPEPESSWIFRNMGRAVHRRNGWCFGISMTNNRVARYESMNGENLKGFHTGAGMTYLYDDDATQYADNFWATVDPYHLPGTTVDDKPIPDGGGRTLPTARWAGGAVLDQRYLAAGMTLQAATTDLRAKKSWFCFDEYVVAAGVGIAATSGYRVRTFLENRHLHAAGENALTVNGVVWQAGQNQGRTFTDARWAHLEGVAGYVFAGPRGSSRRAGWSAPEAGATSTAAAPPHRSPAGT
ncbi:MAG: polysaccharide lyase 8 family protein [Micromonosporaceae bacterium]